MTRLLKGTLPLSLSFALLAMGCSVAGNEGKSDQAELAATAEEWPAAVEADDVKIAEVTLSNGEKLGWYEVAPGVTLLGRATKPGNAPQTDYSEEDRLMLSPAELFDSIVARVPQKTASGAREALVAAGERGQALLDSMKGMEKYRDRGSDLQSKTPAQLKGPATSDVRESKQAAVNDSAWPWSQFQTQLACATHRNWSVSWPFQGGDSWFRRVDNDAVNVGAACYSGTITYQVRVNTWSWETPVSRNLSAGEGWVWDKSNYTFDFDVESKVTNSSGDGYHHCGSGWR